MVKKTIDYAALTEEPLSYIHVQPEALQATCALLQLRIAMNMVQHKIIR